MALERSRNGTHAVDENVGAEDNKPAVAGQDVELPPAAQLRHRKPGHQLIKQIPKMSSRFVKKIPPAVGKALKISRHRSGSGSEGYSSGIEEIPSAMAMEPNSSRDGEHFLRALPGSSIESDGENFLRPPLVENQATEDKEAHEDESNGIREETNGIRQKQEAVMLEREIKNALTFAYFSTSMAGAGIFGFLSGFIGNKKGQAYGIHLLICIVLTLATIVSGASIILIALLRPRIRVSIQIINALKYATLVLLTMATLDASILFLNVYALLAFVPTVVIVMAVFIRAFCHD